MARPITHDIYTIKAPKWGLEFYWDVQFLTTSNSPAIAYPFNTWFPATDVTEVLWNPSSPHIFPVGINSFPVPKNLKHKNFSIIFPDDVYNTLEKWFDDWYTSLYNVDGSYVSVLEEIVRTIVIKKLNSQREVLNVNTYLVFPTSQLVYTGKSVGSVRMYSITMAIAGEIKQRSTATGGSGGGRNVLIPQP
jgi:hypothetical protein